MNATISMEGLWNMIQSLSKRNKQWLADKLSEDLLKPKEEAEEEILAGIARGLKDVQVGKTYPIETLWEQLK